MIIAFMKEEERKGQENIQQHSIIEAVIQKLANEGSHVTLEKTLEAKKNLQQVIQHLITKENILMVTQEAKVKDERFLQLSINVDLGNVLSQLEGSGEAVY